MWHMRGVRNGALLALACGAYALAQQAGTPEVLKGAAAFGDWQQDKPGLRRLITAQDIPPPAASEGVANFSQAVPRPDAAKPAVPDGFTIELVAAGFKTPRVVRTAPNGDLFVAETGANQVRVFRLVDGKSQSPDGSVFLSGLKQPFGLAFYPNGANPQWLYIGNTDSLVRVPYKNGDLKATAAPETIVSGIPTGGHSTRDVVVSPDNKRIFVSVGSESNVADGLGQPPGGVESWATSHAPGATWGSEGRRADVLAFDPDGRNEKVFATGLRNCAGLTIQPATGDLWCVVNERDMLGNNLPFEYATSVREGAFYGWPWYYIGNHEDPRRKGERPDLAAKVTVPDVLMQAHSAPLQIAFYTADAFGPAYKGGAFVTLHGSWNRATRTGYKVVFLPFANGKPTGEYEDFLIGFVSSAKQVWGRPVGVAVASDGSLIVTEDANGTIWRVGSSR
jgi:glucose/arabinose dehydrogenase